MIFVFHLIDHPDTVALRSEMRPQHKEYLGRVAHRIAFAGPLLANDGITPMGSLLAIDFDTNADAEAWQADEPFTKAGLYASMAVQPFHNLWPQRVGFPPA